MQSKKIILSLLLVVGLGLSSTAQVKEFSLKEAQDFAIQNNQQVKNAIIDVAIAARKVKETLAGGLPQASANIGYNNFINLATQLIPAEFFGGEPGTYMEVQFGTKHNASIDAQLSQLIFSGSYIVGLRAAKTYRELSEIQLEQTEQDIRVAIANAYYLVLISQQNKKLMENTVATMNKLLSDTEARFNAGFMEETDVDKFKLLVMDLETAVMNADNQIKNAGYLLKFNLGLDVTDEIRLTDNLETILMSVNPESVLEEDFMLDNHLTYRLLNTQVSLAENQVSLSKTEFMPTVSGFLSQTQNAQRNEFNMFDFNEKWFPTTLAGVQIAIPIFSSGARMHKLKQSQLELEKAKNSQDQVTQSLLMGALTAKNDYEVALDTYKKKLQNYELSQKIYDKDQIRYQKGVSSTTDLNQSYNTMLESQGTYLGAIMDLLNKKLALDQAYNRI